MRTEARGGGSDATVGGGEQMTRQGWLQVNVAIVIVIVVVARVVTMVRLLWL